MLGLGLGVDRASFVAAGFDADYQAVLDRGTTLGYALPTGNALSGGDTLVKSLKSAGIWNKLDIFYVFATNGDSDFATLNWKTPASFQATKVNSPTFTSLEGFTGNGSSSYLNSNYNASTSGVNYTINSASFGYYIRNDIATSIPMGTFDGVGRSWILHGSTILTYEGPNANGGASYAETNQSGFIHLNRDSVTSVKAYQNGVLRSTHSRSTNQIPNRSFYLLAWNNNGTASNFSTGQLSVAFTGSDLSAESSDLFTAIETYMDAIGKGVVA